MIIANATTVQIPKPPDVYKRQDMPSTLAITPLPLISSISVTRFLSIGFPYAFCRLLLIGWEESNSGYCTEKCAGTVQKAKTKRFLRHIRQKKGRDVYKRQVEQAIKSRTDDVVDFKQKTAYEMESRDWSSDVCSSDLRSTIFPMDTALLKGSGIREFSEEISDIIRRCV